MGTLMQDVRYALRQLVKAPGFTATAVLTLALGIGANTAIFTVAKKVLLDALPVSDPQQLRLLTWVSGHERPVPPVWGDVGPTDGGGLRSTAFSYPVFQELSKRTDVFEDLIAFKDIPMTVTANGDPEPVTAEMVSGSAFSALGIQPMLGRPITPGDDTGPGASPVAVISEGFWARRFGRAASVLGSTISVNGVPVTVVGVSPERFTGLQMGGQTELFVPLTMQPLLVPRAQMSTTSLLDNPQSWWVLILARLRLQVPEERMQAELDAVLRQTAMSTLPDARGMDQFHLRLERGDRGLDYLKGGFARPSYVLLALAALVLLLACVNLANLLLARAASRQREISTRLALGAGRMRILRQMLVESLILSCMGGVAGLALGYLGRNAIPRMLSLPWQPTAMQADFDWQVLAFTGGLALATGILFGLVPAWRATRTEVNSALKEASRASPGRRRMWLGRGLVVFQIALSTILLIGAGLFVRTVFNLSHVPLGFRGDHLLLFRLNPPRSRYNDAQALALYRILEEKLTVIPGVRSATMSNIAIIGDHSGSTFHVSGTPVEKDAERVQMNKVGTNFFQTLAIPVLQGRDFDAHDTAATPKVAVVNQALAKRFFPHEDPIGRTFDADAEDVEGPVQIVGIVADTRYADLRSPTPPTFYLPYQQSTAAGARVVEIHTAGEPGTVLSQVHAAVQSLDRDLPLADVRTMTEQIKATMSSERIFANLSGGFGVLALVLACIGIYGVMAYEVSSRTGEIGIRMALGAQTGQILGMLLGQVWWMAAIGAAVGTGSALWLATLVRAMLYGLSPVDPITLAGTAALLTLVALLGGSGPALRASRVDPAQALRSE